MSGASSPEDANARKGSSRSGVVGCNTSRRRLTPRRRFFASRLFASFPSRASRRCRRVCRVLIVLFSSANSFAIAQCFSSSVTSSFFLRSLFVWRGLRKWWIPLLGRLAGGSLPLQLHFLKRNTCAFQFGLFAGGSLPAPDNHIDVFRV